RHANSPSMPSSGSGGVTTVSASVCDSCATSKLGVPGLRPPRRSPGFDPPLGIGYSASFRNVGQDVGNPLVGLFRYVADKSHSAALFRRRRKNQLFQYVLENHTAADRLVKPRAYAFFRCATEKSHRVELVALAPDAILAHGASAVGPLVQATRSVPIIFPIMVDPTGMGFVDSLARPGGNVTGFMAYEYSLSGKWLELLKEIAPGVTRAASFVI